MEVEVGVLDPIGEVEPERDLRELPAERRQGGETLLEQLEDVGRVERPCRRGRRVEYGEAAYVARLPDRLERQELGVEARELSHCGWQSFTSRPAPQFCSGGTRVRLTGTPTEEAL